MRKSLKKIWNNIMLRFIKTVLGVPRSMLAIPDEEILAMHNSTGFMEKELLFRTGDNKKLVAEILSLSGPEKPLDFKDMLDYIEKAKAKNTDEVMKIRAKYADNAPDNRLTGLQHP